MDSIYNYTLKELEEILVGASFKKFNAAQIFDWLYKKRISSFSDMKNISKDLINYLQSNFNIDTIEIEKKEEDKDVKKYLLKLNDDNKVEAVLMNHDYGLSLCISTEIGCNMGCAFCESGRLKKVRELKTNEMIMQILAIEKDIGKRITHLVLMGIGEPFDNYDNVIKFIRIINEPKGIGLGTRHITVSTCGIVPKINVFSKEEGQVNLAISLHAANNDLRDKIMPINKVYNLDKLIEAVRSYILKTNRRVTFEYIMLKGINDSVKEALELCHLLKGMNAYVNLIPYNETSHIEFKKSDMQTINNFYDILKKNNIAVTIRKEFGSKVSAACGQLRSITKED